LPSYAAVAWYFNRLPAPRPENLEAFLHQVEQFAITDYAVALQAGSELARERREVIAKQLSEFTGLPMNYILKADLRVDSGQFRKVLLEGQGLTLGMCDARFSGPSIDPFSKEADPQILPDLSATLSAFVSVVNAYLRGTLHFGGDRDYRALVDVDRFWTWSRDQPPGAPTRIFGIANVMPDLAMAMKANPDLKIMVNSGYFDFCTAYYQAWYEMHHLPIPARLQDNIEYHNYRTGHWPYIHEPSLKELHTNVAEFIRKTDNLSH
jgi:carboxypeptidase C (cathepsin A)